MRRQERLEKQLEVVVVFVAAKIINLPVYSDMRCNQSE
jgi:hypothetical protein